MKETGKTPAARSDSFAVEKTKWSFIDDVHVNWPPDLGPPILFANSEIRRMLQLAKATRNDVLYDLGCGWAQNLLVAAKEFRVKECVGIERDLRRWRKAQKRVSAWHADEQVDIVHGEFEDLIEGKVKGKDLADATIVFYGLETSPEFLEQISSKLSKGCRLVYYYNALFPEIKPNRVDYPFYVSIVPFTKTKSELDWLRAIVRKSHSSIFSDEKPNVDELWQELRHDYDQLGLRKDVRIYQRRIAEFLKE